MTTVYRAVFFQYALDWSPLKSGTIFCLTSTPILFMSPIGGWLADRLGSKIPITLGFCVLISSFFWLAFVVQDSLLMILLGLLAFGIGVPLIFTPSYSAAMGSIPPKKAGSAFGTLATIRALSSTFGVAVITSFATHIQLSSFGTLIEEDPKTKMLNPSFLESLATGVQKIKGYLSAEQLQLVLRYLKESQIKGFFITHLVMGALLLIAFIFVFLLYHRKPSHHLPEAPAEGWD